MFSRPFQCTHSKGGSESCKHSVCSAAGYTVVRKDVHASMILSRSTESVMSTDRTARRMVQIILAFHFRFAADESIEGNSSWR